MRRIVKKKKPDDKQVQLLAALETVRAAREELSATNDPTGPLADQLLHWHRVRQYYELVKTLANEAEALSRYMSYEQLPVAFRQSRVNTRSITLDGIGRFALSSRTTARVIEQQHANEFLRLHNRGDALREMVPASTMNSLV